MSVNSGENEIKMQKFKYLTRKKTEINGKIDQNKEQKCTN